LLWYGLAAVASIACLLPAGYGFLPPARSLPRHSSADMTAAAVSAGVVGMLPAEAWAKGGVYGPLEGKVSSLVHPLVMGSLFFYTCYIGFLGWQWRSTRLIGGEINELKAEIKKHHAGKDEHHDGKDDSAHMSAAEQKLQADLEEKTTRRKELVEGKYKAKHHEASALLLAGGIFFTCYGVFNTWFRTEKLFPGPHLFAGAAVCVLWVLAAACVPYMEKGNETARTAHIGFNVTSVGLFLWQLPTGFEITQKVLNAKIPLI